MAQNYSTLFPTASSSGTGQGGINYAFDAGVNIDGESADVSTWTGTMTIAQTLVVGEVLRGSGSLLLSSSAAAQTKDITFAIPEADEGKLLGITFDMKALGSYAAGDITVQIVEVAGSVIDIPAGQGLFQHSFVSGNAGTYTLRFTNASGAAILAANGLVIDNIVVGPGSIVTGAAVGSPVDLSDFTLENAAAGYTLDLVGSRVGESLHINGYIQLNGANTSALQLVFPSTLTINQNALPLGYGGTQGFQKVGDAIYRDASPTGVTDFDVAVNAALNKVYFVSVDGTNSEINATIPAVAAANDRVLFNLTVPIAEWQGSGTVNMYSEDNLSKWTEYTPTLVGFTANATKFFYKRVDDSMLIRGSIDVNTVTSNSGFYLPTGFTFDTTKMPNHAGAAGAGGKIGTAVLRDSTGVTAHYNVDVASSGTNLCYFFGNTGEGLSFNTNNDYMDADSPFTWTNGDEIFGIEVLVPIAEWANSNQNSLVGFGMATSTQAGLVKSDVDYITSADATTTGLVSTGTQTIAGAKTFSSLITAPLGISTYSGNTSASTTPVTILSAGSMGDGVYIATARRTATDAGHGFAIVAVNGTGTLLSVSSVVSAGWTFSGSGTNVQLARDGGGTVSVTWSLVKVL